MHMDYADWKAPKQDAATLIWPEPARLVEATRANHEALAAASHVRIQNTPLPELRTEARAFVGIDPKTPLVLTGHQTELWHPGVWAKNALIDAAARSLGGAAIHLAVDTDAPKHLNIRWPYFSMPVTDDARPLAWSGLLDPPTPAHLAEVESKLVAAKRSFGYEPMLGEWIQHLRLTVLDGSSGSDLAKAIAAAGHRLDWSLGLDYTINTLSPMLGSRPWLAFVYHVMSHADAFVETYNGSLACYRKQEGIPSTSRPMPDLVVTDQQIEVPFWVDELAGDLRRHRATLERRGGRLYLHHPYSDDSLEIDPTLDAHAAAERLRAFVLSHRLRITPRALTLTMFMRLLVTDLFVHGIGGGRYDQITDRIIHRHFGLTPPTFAVTTATLFLPQALERERACIPCVLQDGHRLKHMILGERKQQVVAQIAAAPRHSRERAELFQAMHRELRANLEHDARIATWKGRLEQARHRAVEDAVIFDREVFYAVQPRERLVELIERYRNAFAVAV